MESKIKTSPAQFQLMVMFMEKHGDLNKPGYQINSKIMTIKNWEKLTHLLNSDGTGATRNTEKWKKVWSDLKNNTKKKNARIEKVVSGARDGYACYAKINELEQRVLNVMGIQVATGLAVEEELQEINIHHMETPMVPITSISPNFDSKENIEIVECPVFSNEQKASHVSSSLLVPLFEEPFPLEPVTVKIEAAITPVASPMHFGSSSPVHPGSSSPVSPGSLSPVHSENLSPVHVAPSQPALSGQTRTQRVRPRSTFGTTRRHMRPALTEQTARHFLHTDEEWRKFKIEQHRDYIEIRREKNRIREMEVQAMKEWRELGSRALDLLDKLFHKYCKD